MNCKVCGGNTTHKFDVNFMQHFMPHLKHYADECDLFIPYYQCEKCGFLFTTYFDEWSTEEWLYNIYNDDYIIFDPNYVEARPKGWAEYFNNNLSFLKTQKGCDYGCGTGVMADVLNSKDWDITKYDPFSENNIKPSEKFDFITSIEVFEHHVEPVELVSNVISLLDEYGFAIILTKLVPEEVKSDWDYIMPRNGHISFYTLETLRVLFSRYGFNVDTFNGKHYVYKHKNDDVVEILRKT